MNCTNKLSFARFIKIKWLAHKVKKNILFFFTFILLQTTIHAQAKGLLPVDRLKSPLTIYWGVGTASIFHNNTEELISRNGTILHSSAIISPRIDLAFIRNFTDKFFLILDSYIHPLGVTLGSGTESKEFVFSGSISTGLGREFFRKNSFAISGIGGIEIGYSDFQSNNAFVYKDNRIDNINIKFLGWGGLMFKNRFNKIHSIAIQATVGLGGGMVYWFNYHNPINPALVISTSLKFSHLITVAEKNRFFWYLKLDTPIYYVFNKHSYANISGLTPEQENAITPIQQNSTDQYNYFILSAGVGFASSF